MDAVSRKTVADRSYFHVSAIALLPEVERRAVEQAIALSGTSSESDFTVVKVAANADTISLLDYPRFFEDGFPVLRRLWTCDLERQVVKRRTYEDSLNPPVLHRKELLLPGDHTYRAEFSSLTASAEQAGLFEDPIRIGFLRSWQRLLAEKGFKVAGNQLLPVGNDDFSAGDGQYAPDSSIVARHLTALARTHISAPVQALFRFGLLSRDRTVFDYGCGRGDDIGNLRECGLAVSGWDPHYAPYEVKTSADIVNLGFVINVIEDRDERAEALRGAYALTQRLLVVSAMLQNQDAANGRPYGDGVLTSRNTFQKYYSQAELSDYIHDVLGEEPLAIAPGIFFVFRDKGDEQRFRYGRLESRRQLQRIAAKARPPRLTSGEKAKAIFQEHAELLLPVWQSWLSLGRAPESTEVEGQDKIVAAFGSWKAALSKVALAKHAEMDLVSQAAVVRSDDLRVFTAKLLFGPKRKATTLEPRLQRDIRAFFGGFQRATDAARALLASLSRPETINEACGIASENGLGWFVESEYLQLHSSLVERLPPALRAYVECGSVLCGEVAAADLVKIHIRSGKLSLMRFDDFAGKPLPRMIQRVKVNLKTQELNVFDYGETFPAPYLYNKARFINEEFDHYSEQLSFEAELRKIGFPVIEDHRPSAATFDAALLRRRYEIDGFSLRRARTPPALDERCGRFLKYRDFIECGETFAATSVDNVPAQADTYAAISDLAHYVVDPTIEYYGSIKLTYAFSSPSLSRRIEGRIAPALDQHASCELKRNGSPVCDRLGAACDLLVEHEDMEEVALWVAANTPFDRIYYYAKDRPIHVSYGPQHSRNFVDMRRSARGTLVPRRRQNVQVKDEGGGSE